MCCSTGFRQGEDSRRIRAEELPSSNAADLDYTDSIVLLYLQETLTFLLLTAEAAAVALTPPAVT